MRALFPAFRTAVVVTALAGAVASSSAIATATEPVAAEGVSAPVAADDAQFVYSSDTGSAVIDILTILFNLPTGSLQKPCSPLFLDGCTTRPPSGS